MLIKNDYFTDWFRSDKAFIADLRNFKGKKPKMG